MTTIYQVKQQVHSVNKSWMVILSESPLERVSKLYFDELVKEHPGVYFELIKITTSEECLRYAQMG